jgi:transposase InsO family protein
MRDADEPLRQRLREISKEDPRFGYRRAWALVRGDGFTANRKRVQRLWRGEGLRVPAQRVKRRRLGSSTVAPARLVATHRNHVWALDLVRHEAPFNRAEMKRAPPPTCRSRKVKLGAA